MAKATCTRQGYKKEKIMKAKKVLSVFLVFVMVISVFSCFEITASAAYTSGDYKYTVNDDGETATITDYTGSDTDITVPTTLDDYTVTAIGSKAFRYCTTLVTVTIESNITSITYSAFWDCTALEELIVSDDNEYYASVDGVLFNADLTKLVVYPAGKTDTEYTVSDTVTTIGSYAFYYSANLVSVTIPATVSTIYSDSFKKCTSLTEINVDSDNEYYTSVDGVLFTSDLATLVTYPAGKTDTEYTIPDTVTEIDSEAFYYCSALEAVVIPDSVITIGSYAFYYCEALSSVTMGSGVEEISSYAFSGCSALTSLELGENVTVLGSGAFSACSSLLSIALPDGLLEIGSNAFNKCTVLEAIDIPDTVTTIGGAAFANCYALTTVEIPESVTSISTSNLFFRCTSLVSVTLPSSTTEIGAYMFYLCPLLESIEIPDGVTAINASAFCYCSSLTEIDIPDSVTYIGDCAFQYCTGLETVIIPSSIEEIGYSAFIYCTSLTKLIVLATEDYTIDYFYYFSVTFSDYTITTVYGYEYTTTEEYATYWGYEFVPITELTTSATCTEDGVYQIVSTEDETVVYEEVTEEATGHSYEWAIATNGYPTKTCSVCENVGAILPFTDISDEADYFDYIAYTSYFNSFITGVKANSTDTTTETFSPRTSLTRAMLVTILYRMAGSPYDDENPYTETPFSDVKAGTWYYNAACWALDNGITTETKFKPNTAVTREQTATFLYRFAGEYLGEDVSTDNDISSYPDASNVSAYAETAMAWANDKGMITGTQQGYLNPQGATLRVHVTKILYNFGLAYNVGNFES